jgi:hypothetical protein
MRQDAGEGRDRMPVSASRARSMALALAGATEAPHVQRLAFRTPRRTFATLDAAARDLNLMLDPELRDHVCGLAPHAFAPVPGGWGRMGITRCDLDAVDEDLLRFALEAAHRLAAPRPRPARRRRAGSAGGPG